MGAPLVSVVVPTFNRADCLNAALDSALGQTVQALEVVVIDDGSTDYTRQLIEERYGKDPRVHYIWQSNLGVSAARNRGLAAASGEYIAFLDSDDQWQPWKLEIQLSCMRRFPDIGMLWTEMSAIDLDGTILSDRFLRRMYSAYRHFRVEQLFTDKHTLRDVSQVPADVAGNFYSGDISGPMFMGNLVHTSTVLLTRERLRKVGGFNQRLRISGEDYDFHLRTCRNGPVGFLDVPTIKYQSARNDRLTRDRFHVYIAINNYRTVIPVWRSDCSRILLPARMVQARLAETHAWVGETLLNRGRSLGIRFLLKSLRYRLRQRRLYKLIAWALLPYSLRMRVKREYRSFRAVRSASGEENRPISEQPAADTLVS